VPLPTGKRTALRQAAAARGSGFFAAALSTLRALRAAGLVASVAPALPESVAATARSAAQLAGVGGEQLLAHVLLELRAPGQEGDGDAASSGSSGSGDAVTRVLLVLAPEAQETRAGAGAAAPCGWASAAAQLLSAERVAHSSGGAPGPPRVAVLQESAFTAAAAGGEEALRAWLRGALLRLLD
jgi:hypothetical protein